MGKYAELRAALEAGVTGASDPTANWLCVGGHTVMLNSGRPVWARIATCEHAPNASCIAACHPEAIRALLAEGDALEVATKEAAEVIVDRNDEIRRLREALRWAAGTLQAACGLAGPISESSPFKLGDETRTVAQICDAADAALAQEQGEPHDNQD